MRKPLPIQKTLADLSAAELDKWYSEYLLPMYSAAIPKQRPTCIKTKH